MPGGSFTSVSNIFAMSAIAPPMPGPFGAMSAPMLM